MEKLKLKETVIVEGRYDKAKLSSLLDAAILTTEGFGIFRDREKLRLIRALAQKDGILILTDSDAAGFRIRSYLAGAIGDGKVTHVYIPDLLGKERRKPRPGAEGKLGVEGMPVQTLLEAFRRAGVSPSAEEGRNAPRITHADLAAWGLSGGAGSAEKRRALLNKLGLPARLNVKGLLEVANKLYSYDDFKHIVDFIEAK